MERNVILVIFAVLASAIAGNRDHWNINKYYSRYDLLNVLVVKVNFRQLLLNE